MITTVASCTVIWSISSSVFCAFSCSGFMCFDEPRIIERRPRVDWWATPGMPTEPRRDEKSLEIPCGRAERLAVSWRGRRSGGAAAWLHRCDGGLRALG